MKKNSLKDTSKKYHKSAAVLLPETSWQDEALLPEYC